MRILIVEDYVPLRRSTAQGLREATHRQRGDALAIGQRDSGGEDAVAGERPPA